MGKKIGRFDARPRSPLTTHAVDRAERSARLRDARVGLDMGPETDLPDDDFDVGYAAHARRKSRRSTTPASPGCRPTAACSLTGAAHPDHQGGSRALVDENTYFGHCRNAESLGEKNRGRARARGGAHRARGSRARARADAQRALPRAADDGARARVPAGAVSEGGAQTHPRARARARAEACAPSRARAARARRTR